MIKFLGVGKNICLFVMLFSMASVAEGLAIKALQIEADTDGTMANGIQYYAPVDFYGVSPYTSPYTGIVYYAWSGAGSASPRVSVKSGHAETVWLRLLAADGPDGNVVSANYCVEANDFLSRYVKYRSSSSSAIRPDPVGYGIKIVNNSWAGSLGNNNTDAIRRLDYMIQREDLVMTNSAVSSSTSPTPIAWASRNGIAVRGTQGFTPTGPAIGKTHADLWGPKIWNADQQKYVDEAASYETPGVAGYAAALINVADQNGWSNGTNGLRHEVVKSVLMTGADKTDFLVDQTPGGDKIWNHNGVNNLSNVNGAGRADYDASLAILNGGPQNMFSVAGTTISSPVRNDTLSAWTYNDSIVADGKQAMLLDLRYDDVHEVTATLAWDVTQLEVGDSYLNTTSNGTKFANLDLELLPVAYHNGAYTLGSSLGLAGLMSNSTDDNVEHLYYHGELDPGYYAFVVSLHGNSVVPWDYGYGFSYEIMADALPTPEPGTLCLLLIAIVSIYGIRRGRLLGR